MTLCPVRLRATATAVLILGPLTASAGAAVVQEEPAPMVEVGAEAPDFEVTGATRFGLLEQPVHLSDFRGKTVVLAFFIEARTPG